jgi:tRNA(Arg) A34 adenosine deaminase TadA
MLLDPTDETHLRAAIELARQARENGNHPFGALLADPAGAVLLGPALENRALAVHDGFR